VTVSWQLLLLVLFEIIQAWVVAELCASLPRSRGHKWSDHNRLTQRACCILAECVYC